MRIRFRRVTGPLKNATLVPAQPFSRAALSDALAWPIALTVSTGALALAAVARITHPPYRLPAMGACVALLVAALVLLLAARIHRWTQQQAQAVGAEADTLVQVDAQGALQLEAVPPAILPAVLPMAEVLARRTRTALQQAHAADVSAWARGAAAVMLAHSDEPARMAAVAQRIRDVTAPVQLGATTTDLAALVHAAAAAITDAGLQLVVEIESAPLPVRTDAAQLHAVLGVLLRAAIAASPADAPPIVHLARVFRSTVEEEPVRRAGDHARTIVPRTPVTPLRAWAASTRPPAELARLVIADRGPAPGDDQLARALQPFAVPRPGDAHGVAVPHLARIAAASDGTVWVNVAREGGWAVHLLLPIAPRH